jgi:prolyl 4-hydroxylase
MNTPASPDGDAVAIALDAWRRGETGAALDRLDAAARAGDGAALEALLQLSGQDAAPGGTEERIHGTVLALPPGPVRNRHLAFLTAAGRGCKADPGAALALRAADAADGGDTGALTELGLLALMAGDSDAARRRLETAAARGGGHAIAALLRLGAEDGAVAPVARQHGPALARAGHPLAGTLMQAVAGLPDAEPAGAPDKVATRPEALAEALCDAHIGDGEVLSQTPRVARHDGALPAAVCDYLAAGGVPFLQPARIFDPATGESRPDPYRTSLTAALPDSAMDLVLWAIKRRMAQLAGAGFAQGEPLSLLVYRPGEEYRAHFDFLTEDGGRASADLARRGQRIATSLVKLNDEHEGGATRFPRLDIAWTGRRGDALSFVNVDAAGKGDKRTLHAGEPVTSGMKVLASLWLRERA